MIQTTLLGLLLLMQSTNATIHNTKQRIEIR